MQIRGLHLNRGISQARKIGHSRLKEHFIPRLRRTVTKGAQRSSNLDAFGRCTERVGSTRACRMAACHVSARLTICVRHPYYSASISVQSPAGQEEPTCSVRRFCNALLCHAVNDVTCKPSRAQTCRFITAILCLVVSVTATKRSA